MVPTTAVKTGLAMELSSPEFSVVPSLALNAVVTFRGFCKGGVGGDPD